MKYLARNEEIILLAIWKLKGNAYGNSIREHVIRETNKTWLSGTIYGTLYRLEKNGYIETTTGEATEARAGRPKIFYTITKTGMQKLVEIQEINASIWTEVPKLTPQNK